MKATLKYPAKLGGVLLPKGTEGLIIGVSNSPQIAAAFPNLQEKVDGHYYIVRFPNMDDCLFDKKQIDIV